MFTCLVTIYYWLVSTGAVGKKNVGTGSWHFPTNSYKFLTEEIWVFQIFYSAPTFVFLENIFPTG